MEQIGGQPPVSSQSEAQQSADRIRLLRQELATPELRGALWSALYAGSHAILAQGIVKAWEPDVFGGLLS